MTEKTYRACIFDLDGTLANTISSIAGFCNETLEQFGFPAIPTGEYKMMVGNGADMLIRRMAARSGAALTEENLKAMRAEYDRRYEAEPMKLVTAYPGLLELLSHLKEWGIKIGVVSNKPDNMTRYIVQALYGELIDTVRGQQAGVPTKPDPAAVLETASILGVLPQDILYVGDSGVDMDTGNNAGMDACGVLWGFRTAEELLSHGAKYLAKNAGELEKLILGATRR